MQRSNDSTYEFRQDSNFWYLTGLDTPNCVLVLEANDEYVIVPEYTASQAAFNCRPLAADLSDRSGIHRDNFLTPAEGRARLRRLLRATKQASICTAPRAFDTWHGLYTNPARQRLQTYLRRTQPGLTLHDLRPALATMRCTKQPEELAAIERAVTSTCESIDEIRRSATLRTYTYGYEIELALAAGFRRRGARGHAWTPIVAGGVAATTVHNEAKDVPLMADELLVVDVGAEVEAYTADITRTLAQRPLTARQQAVHTAVLEVQQAALDLLVPGQDYRRYEQAVTKYMGRQLRQLGLITSASDIEQIRRYYPHASSHFMGLDVHDVGDYRQPLGPNMVLTCEPGIYIREEAIGVRIEDDVVLTSTGHTVLSAACHPMPYTP